GLDSTSPAGILGGFSGNSRCAVLIAGAQSATYDWSAPVCRGEACLARFGYAAREVERATQASPLQASPREVRREPKAPEAACYLFRLRAIKAKRPRKPRSEGSGN